MCEDVQVAPAVLIQVGVLIGGVEQGAIEGVVVVEEGQAPEPKPTPPPVLGQGGVEGQPPRCIRALGVGAMAHDHKAAIGEEQGAGVVTAGEVPPRWSFPPGPRQGCCRMGGGTGDIRRGGNWAVGGLGMEGRGAILTLREAGVIALMHTSAVTPNANVEHEIGDILTGGSDGNHCGVVRKGTHGRIHPDVWPRHGSVGLVVSDLTLTPPAAHATVIGHLC